MPLKALVTDINEVPEPLRELYTESEDGFVLNVDDRDYKSKLDEFRTNNRELYKKRQEAESTLKRYEGVDPEKYREAVQALEILDKSEDAALIKEGRWEDVIKKRTENLRSSYENQIRAKDEMMKTLAEDANTYKSKYADLFIDTSVTNAITSIAQPRKGALTDILLRARREWQVEDGKLKGKDLYNEKGDPMTVEDWGRKLVSENSYLFEPSQGGGAIGGTRPRMNGERKVIDRNDPVAIGRHAADIAAGKAVVSES